MRIPSDYFVRPRAKRSFPVLVVRTVLGVALIGAGIAMLVLPGQGVLTILIGLSVLELSRMIEKLLRMPRVYGAIDAIRRNAGKRSLAVPAPIGSGS